MDIDPIMDQLGLPVGYGLHNGYILNCTEGHLIAILVMDPNAKDAAGNSIDNIRVGNKSHDGTFQLDPSQTDFPTTLKCHCGAGVKL